jgi:hypothetical protein
MNMQQSVGIHNLVAAMQRDRTRDTPKQPNYTPPAYAPDIPADCRTCPSQGTCVQPIEQLYTLAKAYRNC